MTTIGNATCGCHIGHVHLPHLNLGETVGHGLPKRPPARRGCALLVVPA